MAGRQAVCVTRFDQSECVICGVISWKELLSEANYGEIHGEIFAFFQACAGGFDTIAPWKVAGTLSLS